MTTDSNHRLGVAANWLDGDFVADAPNRKWAGDITYIWTSEGWLYLAVILDLPFDCLPRQALRINFAAALLGGLSATG